MHGQKEKVDAHHRRRNAFAVELIGCDIYYMNYILSIGRQRNELKSIAGICVTL